MGWKRTILQHQYLWMFSLHASQRLIHSDITVAMSSYCSRCTMFELDQDVNGVLIVFSNPPSKQTR